MSARRLLLLIFSLAAALRLVAAHPSADAAHMGVNDIRPGMVGIGRTVFDGTHVEEFKAHILGVLENIIGPHRNLILARLEGGPLAHTGVIAGMSRIRRSEEHTSELQSRSDLVCRLLLEKKKKKQNSKHIKRTQRHTI